MRAADHAAGHGRQLQERRLAMVVRAPAQAHAVAADGAGEGIAGGHLHEGAGRCRSLAVDVAAPAGQLAVGADGAGMVPAHAEGAELVGGERGTGALAGAVVAHAFDAAVHLQSALVVEARLQHLPVAGNRGARCVARRPALARAIGGDGADPRAVAGQVAERAGRGLGVERMPAFHAAIELQPAAFDRLQGDHAGEAIGRIAAAEGVKNVTPPAGDPAVGGQGTTVVFAGHHLGERAGWRCGLPRGVVAPAGRAAVAAHLAGMRIAGGDLAEGGVARCLQGGGDGGLAVIVATPASHAAVRLQAAGVEVARRHRQERAGLVHRLTVVEAGRPLGGLARAPAGHAAVRLQAAGVVQARRHRQERAGLAVIAANEGVAQLAVTVVAPAGHAAVRLQAAGVQVACRHRQERAGHAGRGLSEVVPAPAGHAAVRLQCASVPTACRHRHDPAGAFGAADRVWRAGARLRQRRGQQPGQCQSHRGRCAAQCLHRGVHRLLPGDVVPVRHATPACGVWVSTKSGSRKTSQYDAARHGCRRDAGLRGFW